MYVIELGWKILSSDLVFVSQINQIITFFKQNDNKVIFL